jgi:hypothetical protein
MLAGLVWGVDRRAGPLVIALSASLKAVPILYVLLYVARGEWHRVAWTIGLTTALVLPMLLFDLGTYPTQPGNRPSLIYLGTAWYIAAVLGSVALALLVAMRSERFGLMAISAATFVAVPRLLAYDLSYLLVGAHGAITGDVRSRHRRIADER